MDPVSYSYTAKQAKRIDNFNQVSEIEPLGVEVGTEWYVPSTGKLYKRVNDGTNDIWVDTNSTANNAAIQKSEEFVAGTASNNYTGSLSTFTTLNGYTIGGYIEVYLNGKMLGQTEFTATDGSTVVLVIPATTGDIVKVQVFGTFVLADTYTKATIDATNAAQDSLITTKANDVEVIHKNNIDESKIGSLTIGESKVADTWSYVGSTITLDLTTNGHNTKVGDTIYVSGIKDDGQSSIPLPNGKYIVTAVSPTSITYDSGIYQDNTGIGGQPTVKYGELKYLGGDSFVSVGDDSYAWVDETANRVAGTTYTNTTGKPIMVVITKGGNTSDTVSIDGILVLTLYDTSNQWAVGTIIVPNGSTYVYSGTGTIITWLELK